MREEVVLDREVDEVREGSESFGEDSERVAVEDESFERSKIGKEVGGQSRQLAVREVEGGEGRSRSGETESCERVVLRRQHSHVVPRCVEDRGLVVFAPEDFERGDSGDRREVGDYVSSTVEFLERDEIRQTRWKGCDQIRKEVQAFELLELADLWRNDRRRVERNVELEKWLDLADGRRNVFESIVRQVEVLELSETLEVFGDGRETIVVAFETREVGKFVEGDVLEVDDVVAADVESSEVLALADRLRESFDSHVREDEFSKRGTELNKVGWKVERSILREVETSDLVRVLVEEDWNRFDVSPRQIDEFEVVAGKVLLSSCHRAVSRLVDEFREVRVVLSTEFFELVEFRVSSLFKFPLLQQYRFFVRSDLAFCEREKCTQPGAR